MLSPWLARSEGEEAIIEVIIITIKRNLDHPIDQSQWVEIESVCFVVSVATQRKKISLRRKNKKM